MKKQLSWEWWQTTADKPAALFVAITHAGLIALVTTYFLFPKYFSWSGIYVFVIMYVISGLGITLGYHRLLTHNSFRTFATLRRFIALCGCLALQGGPARWIGNHRKHHQCSDRKGDPHTPKDGFNWAHALWAVSKDPPDFNPLALATDITSDPFLKYLHTGLWMLPQICVSILICIIGYYVGGLAFSVSWLLWDLARVTMVYHITWSVNSAAHTWGYRTFDTNDQSRNLWILNLPSLGETNHNDHHKFPNSARHGQKWWELDPTWWIIWCMEKVNLAWGVKRPKSLS